MIEEKQEKRFAVLIDAENISAKYIKFIMDEISNYGEATYKRIYGDWTKPSAISWKDVLLENSVSPVQQYSYTQGKNATDSAMIIDAMDILYSHNIEGFCLVSSDSDFTKLSSRLRESGMFVLGMGEKKTPKPFVSSCNQFKYLDVIAESEKKALEAEKAAEKAENIKTEETNVVKAAKNGENEKSMTNINEIHSAVFKMLNENDAEDQRLNMGEIGNRLVKRYPDFDVRNYGYTKLSKFLKSFDFISMDSKSLWVTMRTDKAAPKKIAKGTKKKQ